MNEELHYKSDKLDTGQRFLYSSVLGGVHLIFGMILFVAAVAIVPHYAHRFEEFGIKLPQVTLIVIVVCRWVRNYWYIVLMAGVMAIMLDWFTLLVVGKLGRRRLLFFGGLLTLLPILLGAIVFFSIWTPWMTLLEGLQGS